MANNPPKELATKKKKTTTSTTSSKSKTSSKTASKTTKAATKAITKAAKKNPIGAIVIGTCLILGAVAGYAGFSAITKNDTFEMNAYSYVNEGTNVEGESARDLYGDLGKETAILLLNEEYVEPFAKCVAFGKDVTSEVMITYFYREDISHEAIKVDEVDTSISGFYYASYISNSFKYQSVELIRNIIVVEVEQNG